MKKKPEYYFLSVFFICSLSAMSALGFFNYLIDPYAYFLTASFQGINEKKIPATSQERFEKAIQVMSKKPQAIMLGSSRVRAGFPTTYYSQLTGQSAYKAAFSGARFNEIFAYFEHALNNQENLKAVFIGLDFFSFSKNLSVVSEFSEERIRRTYPLMNDFFKLLFSQTTLKYSLATLKHNRDPKKFEISNRTHVKVDEGDYVDLGVSMIESPQDFLKAEKRVIFDEYAIDPLKVEMFKKIVQTCREKNIDLKIVFLPSHVHYWEAIYQCQRWQDFEQLKRQLCAIHPIYDFSGFSELNAEPLSKESVGTYFFETSHFTPHYGRAILDKIYGVDDRCRNTGFFLTPTTVEEHLKTIREQRNAWVEKHPEESIWLQKHLLEQ